MIESTVRISMRDDNDLNCSYAIVCKGNISIIIILKDCECAIFDYNILKTEKFIYKYLLPKHYNSNSSAYHDFLKLIGKMCKKEQTSKYFLYHKEEDNRMIFSGLKGGHMITESEKITYAERFLEFKTFILNNKDNF